MFSCARSRPLASKSYLFRKKKARHVTRGLDVVGPQCVQARIARRAQSSAAEADLDEFRAGIHNDRGFDNHFRESAAGDGVGGG